MEWKEELEEQIEANIDWWWEKAEFAKTLLGILREAPSEEIFVSNSMSKAKECYDPWIRDELCSFVKNLECVCWC